MRNLACVSQKYIVCAYTSARYMQTLGKRTEGGPGKSEVAFAMVEELHRTQSCEPGKALCKVQPLRRVFKVQPKRFQPLERQHLREAIAGLIPAPTSHGCRHGTAGRLASAKRRLLGCQNRSCCTCGASWYP